MEKINDETVLAFLERPVESSIAIGVIAAGIPTFYLLKKNQVHS